VHFVTASLSPPYSTDYTLILSMPILKGQQLGLFFLLLDKNIRYKMDNIYNNHKENGPEAIHDLVRWFFDKDG